MRTSLGPEPMVHHCTGVFRGLHVHCLVQWVQEPKVVNPFSSLNGQSLTTFSIGPSLYQRPQVGLTLNPSYLLCSVLKSALQSALFPCQKHYSFSVNVCICNLSYDWGANTEMAKPFLCTAIINGLKSLIYETVV